MTTRQDEFLRSVAARRAIRVAVRSLCFHEGALLVQRPADEPESCLAFVGGALEFGELMEDRIRREYHEETGREVTRAEYLFVVENRFQVDGGIVHSLEHYFRVALDDYRVESREPHLVHFWLPSADLASRDVRPHVVRDEIVDGSWRTVRRLVVPFA